MAAPSPRQVRAYILDLVVELGDLARAYGETGLASDLRKVAESHCTPTALHRDRAAAVRVTPDA
jgi:hypothetical protein